MIYTVLIETDNNTPPDPEQIKEAIEAIPNHRIVDGYWEDS